MNQTFEGRKVPQRKAVFSIPESGRLREVGRLAKKTIKDMWESHFVSLNKLKGAGKMGAQH